MEARKPPIIVLLAFLSCVLFNEFSFLQTSCGRAAPQLLQLVGWRLAHVLAKDCEILELSPKPIRCRNEVATTVT